MLLVQADDELHELRAAVSSIGLEGQEGSNPLVSSHKETKLLLVLFSTGNALLCFCSLLLY